MKKSTGSRREGRTLAVQLLFMLDHNTTPIDEQVPAFFAFRTDDDRPLAESEKSRVFCESLVRGVVEHSTDIDARIKETAQNFSLHRIGGVERAILRLAVHEMFNCLDTPPVVAINEALEIARRMSGDEAVRFVNGILDRIRGTLKRPSRTAVVPLTAVERMERQMENIARELGEATAAEPEDYSPGRGQAEQGS
ncbi:MAG: transcription antitermination factor NusB [Chthoniobacteraceae bacterium]